jgi:hypothetical protein
MLASTLAELNYRNSNGIEVFLLWDSITGQTFIAVCDSHEDSEIMFPVAPEKAADAFQHPYAYLTAAPNSTAVVVA